MICEILHPIFDAFDAEFRFHGLECGGNCGSVRRSNGQIGNAKNLRRIKQRKGFQSSDIRFRLNHQVNGTYRFNPIINPESVKLGL